MVSCISWTGLGDFVSEGNRSANIGSRKMEFDAGLGIIDGSVTMVHGVDGPGGVQEGHSDGTHGKSCEEDRVDEAPYGGGGVAALA